MGANYKFVEFEQYCKTCEHKKTFETDEPCNECLHHPVMEFSHKPYNYKEKTNKKGTK